MIKTKQDRKTKYFKDYLELDNYQEERAKAISSWLMILVRISR